MFDMSIKSFEITFCDRAVGQSSLIAGQLISFPLEWLFIQLICKRSIGSDILARGCDLSFDCQIQHEGK
jgi:hypothetical protein